MDSVCQTCTIERSTFQAMRKYVLDLKVTACRKMQADHVLLQLALPDPMPSILPGQFVELRVDRCPDAFLRRPISVHYVDRERRELWLLIRMIGPGTKALGGLQVGETVNVLFPLGHGFTLPADVPFRPLLVGGGVGCAPLLYLGAVLLERGCQPTILLGAKSKDQLVQLDIFGRYGPVYTTTEDGSAGEQGFVTQHTIMRSENNFDMIYSCGPLPMMKAVAHYAREKGIACEVSLENKMACGLGACLCCVENTTEGHLCVCTDGPVFNIDKLLW